MAAYNNTSIERGFKILEYLSSEYQAASASRVAEAADLPISTAFRLLAVLVNLGYIERTDDDMYRLGYRLYKLSGHANEITFVKRAAHQILAELARQTGLTVHMATLEGSQVVYHAKFESTHSMNIVSAVGARLDAHVSAVGKVLLGHLSGIEIDKLYRGRKLSRHTGKSITSVRELKKELTAVRENGVAFDNEEIIPGLKCIAVPVYDYEGELLCAISISGSTMHMTDRYSPSRTAALQAAAADISEQLAGSRRWEPGRDN